MKIYLEEKEFGPVSIDMITGEVILELENISNIESTNFQALKKYKKEFGIAFPFLTDGKVITIAGSGAGYYKPNLKNDLALPFKYDINNLATYMSLLIKHMIIKPYIDESKRYVADTFQIDYNNQKCIAKIENDFNGYYLNLRNKPNNWILKELKIKNNTIESILDRSCGGLWPYGSKEDVYLLIDYINSNYSNNIYTSKIVIADRFYFNNQYYDYRQSKKNGWYIDINLNILAKYLSINIQNVRNKLCRYSNNKVGVFPEFKTKENLINGLKRLLNVY